MMKKIAILLTLCLVAMPALAAANGPGSGASPSKKEEGPKPLVLDLTPLNGEKYYILDKVIFRESNDFVDLQPDPFYSEGKKKVIEGDEKILA